MNALALYHDLEARGINLEIKDEYLKVDAPVGVLTDEHLTALKELKPELLRIISCKAAGELEHDGRRFDAKPSRHPGYTSLYDPSNDEWHDFPTRDCYPSIVAIANKKRRKGRVA